jgi:hypothetical protein
MNDRVLGLAEMIESLINENKYLKEKLDQDVKNNSYKMS